MGSVKLYRSLKNNIELNSPIIWTTDVGSTTGTFFNAISAAAQNVTVDWGDGTSNTYTMGVLNTIGFTHTYSAPWGAGVDKTIRIQFTDNALVRTISINSADVKGPAPSGLESLTNATTIVISSGNKMTTFPAAVLNLTALTTLTLASVFKNDSVFEGKIPIEIFNKPLVSLTYDEAGIGPAGFVPSNMDKIYLLAGTLVTLAIGSNLTALPNDAVYGFQHLVNLQNINLNGRGSWGSPPSVLNQIISLVFIDLTSNGLTGFGDLSALININRFRAALNSSLADTLPAWFKNWILLKNLDLSNCYATNARINNFINSLYDLIQQNSTGSGSVGNFRGFTNTNISGGVATGTFQAPNGFRLNTTPFTITNITKANPAVITFSSIGNLVNNDIIFVKDVVGMTEINNQLFKLANILGSTAELQTVGGVAIDSTSYTTYLSGGKASSDGNPASQKEKLYVLVNNYVNTITYS